MRVARVAHVRGGLNPESTPGFLPKVVGLRLMGFAYLVRTICPNN